MDRSQRLLMYFGMCSNTPLRPGVDARMVGIDLTADAD